MIPRYTTWATNFFKNAMHSVVECRNGVPPYIKLFNHVLVCKTAEIFVTVAINFSWWMNSLSGQVLFRGPVRQPVGLLHPRLLRLLLLLFRHRRIPPRKFSLSQSPEQIRFIHIMSRCPSTCGDRNFIKNWFMQFQAYFINFKHMWRQWSLCYHKCSDGMNLAGSH